MKFVKKLFVLTGHGGKGAATVESNAFGTFAQVGVGLPPCRGKRYFVFVSDKTKVFPMNGGDRFDLGDVSVSPAHLAVVAVAGKDFEVELYGTDCDKKMWQSNLLDMARGKINDFEKATNLEEYATEGARERQKEKTLSLFPTVGGYDDGAIAKVNYYSNIYSSREKTPSEVAFERSRLEELGDNLLKARFDVQSTQPVEVTEKSEEIIAERLAENRADNKTAETAAEENKSEDEAAAAVAVDGLPRYARFLYSYRDELLKRGAERAEAKEEKQHTAKILSEKREDVFLTAPKTDILKSETMLKETAPKKLNFYERMKSKIDRLFEEGTREPVLEKLLPSSRFVKIAVEDSDKYYCVGLVGSPDYICYAVSAVYTPQPPEELDGYCQWLPTDENRPEGDGFWVIYQDAVSGDSVSM